MRNFILGIFAFLISTNAVCSTIEDCADRLPLNHEFTLEIKASINTKEASDKVKGQLTIVPKQKLPDGVVLDEKPFINCVVQLIKINTTVYD